jgi:DNA-binding CsgD family transcriptional regulator
MLLERAGELAAIGDAVRLAAAGGGSALALEGPPGIGKSALLDAAREDARAAGLVVLSARGGELEREFPYGVVRQLLERVAREDEGGLLAGAAGPAAPALGLPATVAGGGEGGGFALANGLFWVVCNLADRAPVLVVLDDAHWSDRPSLRFLLYLARRLEGVGVCVMLAARAGAGEQRGVLGELLSEPAVGVLRPLLLSADASAELVHGELGSGVSEEFALACHVASGGNPFLLGELLAAVRGDGVGSDAVGARRVAALSPRGVSRAVLLRLRRLPAQATALARAVVTLGGDAALRHAAALAGVRADRAVGLCDRLVDVGVLTPGRPLRFVHPVIGEAIRDDMGAGERAGLHARAARLLAADGQSADRIAPQLLLTDTLGDPWVADTLREAAAIARSRGAPDAASRWLERALAEGASEDRPALLRELGEAQWLAGEIEPALTHLRAALASAPDHEASAQAALLLARALASSADITSARAVLEHAARDFPTASEQTRMRIEAELPTYALLSGVDVQRAAERIERFADLRGEDAGERLVLCTLAAVHLHIGTADDAAAFAIRGLADSGLLGDAAGDSFPYLAALSALCLGDRHEQARAVLDQAIQQARARGSAIAFAYACGSYAMLHWIAGDVRECEQSAREALEPGIPTGYARPILHAYLALALTERGELEQAQAALQTPDAPSGETLLAQSSHAVYALARLRLAQGRPQDALDTLREHGQRADQSVNLLPYPPWRLETAECLLALGECEQAQALVAEHAPHAQRWGTLSAIGVTIRAQALTAPAEDRISLLMQAEATLRRSPARLARARTLVDLGAAQRAAGQRTDAQHTLRAALELATQCGSTLMADHAHEELRATGAKPRRPRLTGSDALTASERRICQLAAVGHTNTQIAQALFITRSTVEKHLGHAYQKLGIHTRDQLAAALTNPNNLHAPTPLASVTPPPAH